MALKSKFFQASFSTTVLRSAALAIALLIQTSPARAETLALTCESTAEGSGTQFYRSPVKFQVDLDQRIIRFLDSGGSTIASTTDVLSNSRTHSVRITDSSIKWLLADSEGFPYFAGLIDRDSGNTEVSWVSKSRAFSNVFQGRCRRATQKF
jgi:hypothetical protein